MFFSPHNMASLLYPLLTSHRQSLQRQHKVVFALRASQHPSRLRQEPLANPSPEPEALEEHFHPVRSK